MAKSGENLYEKFARELEEQIKAGSFPPGSRIPALREASEHHGLSLSTVLQAYRLLENRGLIEAKPQSGYYVKWRPRVKAMAIEPILHADLPTDVQIDEVTMRLIQDTHEESFAQFGAAFPDPGLLPTARMNRIVAELARSGRFSREKAVRTEGCEELRVQVAQRAYGHGCSLSPDDIIVTAGCSEAIMICLQALCRPGDLVAIESPTYFGLLLALDALHLKALEIPAHPGTGMSLDALMFAVENHPVRVVAAIPNFSNPLGSRMPAETKRELVAFLAERDIPLIENDIYGELYFSGERPGVAKSSDDKGLVLLCSSFSKDLSETYRVGWLVPGRFREEAIRIKMALNMGTSVLPQLAIAKFLETGGYDQHLRKIRKAYAQKVATMSSAIERHFPPGTVIAEPLGGYLIWLRLPEGMDSLALYREAVKASITIAPGCIFSPSGKHRDCLRLNASAWSEGMEKDLARLGRIATRLLEGEGVNT